MNLIQTKHIIICVLDSKIHVWFDKTNKFDTNWFIKLNPTVNEKRWN